MRRMAFLLATMMVALLVASGVAFAATQIDQKQTSQNGFTLADAQQRFAQTFTAGITGKLNKVSVLAGCCTRVDPSTHMPVNGGLPPGDMILKIFAVDSSGFPTGSALAIQSVPKENFTTHDGTLGWMKVTFKPAVSVRAGKKYALVMTAQRARVAPYDYKYLWAASSGDLYSRGFVSYRLGDAAWTSDQIDGWDQAFKTYIYVPTS